MERISPEKLNTELSSSKSEINQLKNTPLEKFRDKFSKPKPFFSRIPLFKFLTYVLISLIVIMTIFLIIKIKTYIFENKCIIPPLITPALPPLHKDDYRIIAINYANEGYSKAQNWNTKTALEVGDVDGVLNFSPNNIDKHFKKTNEKILKQYRGDGYYLWKPYIILKTLEEVLDEGEYLVYTDSGIIYLNSTRYLVNIMERNALDILAFSLESRGSNNLERYLTKRDCFILMGCDESKYSETPQFTESFVVYKKSKFTLDFIKEELKYAKDPRIVTDMMNTLGYQNYPGFYDHKHTQSIFSLLLKKYQIQGFREPNQWGGYKILSKEDQENNKDDFPIMFYSHQRNIDSLEDVYDNQLKKYFESINNK